ncbi:multiple epidermal growth factor-like domains protein 10 [Saccostrea echinata]|uniref:multiple epidermal growth factor-like domains protein 10 n=1 Tax=Saccostrea echinata TaxID=191078 RepID=UPI002A81DEED|nr:multiple epidermal growth factor-like domains protein 10 [Saccostrea echinata]
MVNVKRDAIQGGKEITAIKVTNSKCDGNEYGDSCNETCRKCMDSEPCHHVNGSCVNGCESGYQGNKCDRVCDFGFYGPNCKIACSTFCEVSRDCHPMTGACKSGCKAGVKGSECLVVQDNYQIKFYGIMISFCVTLPLTELCLFYKIMKRIINSQERKDKTYHHQRDEVFLLKRDDSAVPETQENNQVLKGE